MNIDIRSIAPVDRLFHNEKIKTYETFVDFEDIKYWDKNLRTVLAFEILEDKFKKNLSEISREDITSFLISREDIQLTALAKSIESNGVRVPLIILKDGTLLDGNRRYFACSYLFDKFKNKKYEIPEYLKKIPVWVIKTEDINERQKNKVLAEANFVKDLKVPWTLDVKAKVISEMYISLKLENKKSDQEIFDEIENIYSIKKSDSKAYVETILLTEEFISLAGDDLKSQFSRRTQVLKKFVYFWEFRNKALNGRGCLDSQELGNVKPLFFKMIELGRFSNIHQVEPMARSIRDNDLWKMLVDSAGIKISEVEILYREKKIIKSSEDKVRNFFKWLSKEDSDNFTKATYVLLDDLSKIIDEKKGSQHG